MNKNAKFKKTHPYTFVNHLKISVILILLSLLQQFLIKPQSIPEIIGSLGINALYVFAVLLYYTYSYGNYKYRLEKDGVHIKRGVFLDQDFILPYHRIQTVVFYRDAVSSVFGAERISVDTPAGSRSKYDITGYFTKKTALRIKKLYKKGRTMHRVYRSRMISIILMSAFWSNPLTGMIFIVPVINSAAKITGSQFAQDIIRGSLNPEWSPVAWIISPAAAGLATLILMCWLISALLYFLRYVRLRSSVLGENIIISRGLISKTITCTRISAVSSVSIEHSLLMRLLRLRNCAVTVIGSGKLKGDKGLIVSAEYRESANKYMTELTGIPHDETVRIDAAKGSIYSYVYYPCIYIILLTALSVLSYNFFPFNEAIWFLISVFYIILFWWLLFRIFACRHSHLGINEKALVVCTFKGLTLKKHYIPFDMIRKTEISQMFTQEKKGKCHLKVTIYGEKRLTYKIKQLPLKETKELLLKAEMMRGKISD